MKVNQTRGALYLLCISRAGYRDGARLIEFIEEWRRCVEKHERAVTPDEFATWTRRYGRRSTFYLLKLFRETFPQLGEHGQPDGLMAPLIERLLSEVPVT
jgi:hypothetical protein